ncbi:MAG: hypothetical protein H6807_04135 [Planctomycetes bacterium]|nr:hypothetical protein [Planctomycetota bacterium]
MKRFLSILSVVALASAALNAQVTRFVPGGFPTIQSAINASANNDIVIVAPGVYFENLVITGKHIKLSGAGAASTIVDGGMNGPVLSIGPNLGRSLLVENLTFRNGKGADTVINGAGAQGGGIDIRISSPTILRCDIINNRGGNAAGMAIGGAGGILVRGDGPDPAGPAIRNCNVLGNIGGTNIANPTAAPAAHGGAGGILVEEGTAFIRACIIRNNIGGDSMGAPNFRGSSAGGIGVILPSNLTVIEDCEIHNNFGGHAGTGARWAGAGGVGAGGAPYIHYCNIGGNQGGDALAPALQGAPGAVAGAGGVDCVAATIDNTYIRGNHGGLSGIDGVQGGAGGVNATGNALITGCVIGNNVGGDDLGGPGIAGAGGLHSTGGAVIVLATTIAGNVAGTDLNPGPIAEALLPTDVAGGVQADGGSVDISNSILYGDTGDLGGNFFVTAGDEIGGSGQVNVSYSNVEGLVGGIGNFDLDPLFVDAPNNDFHLSPNSPCIDAGDPQAVGLTPKDIDGDPRVIGLGLDIGGDESAVMVMPGSLEDLELNSRVNNQGDLGKAAKFLRNGDTLELRVYAPNACFNANDMYVVGSPLPTGVMPPSVPSLPGFHLNPLELILLGPGPMPYWEAPYLCGKRFFFHVGPTVPGWSLWVQGFALDSNAANGWFAVTDVHEFRFE